MINVQWNTCQIVIDTANEVFMALILWVNFTEEGTDKQISMKVLISFTTM